MATLTRRLGALEELAKQRRIREIREAIGDEIVRRSRQQGLLIAPSELGAKTDRVLAIMETGATLLASGLTLDGVARRLAVEHELDPDRVAELYHESRAGRGATP